MFYASFLIKLEIISIEGRDPLNHLFSLQSKSRLGGNRSIQSLVYNAILVRIVRMVICYLKHLITCFITTEVRCYARTCDRPSQLFSLQFKSMLGGNRVI